MAVTAPRSVVLDEDVFGGIIDNLIMSGADDDMNIFLFSWRLFRFSERLDSSGEDAFNELLYLFN